MDSSKKFTDGSGSGDGDGSGYGSGSGSCFKRLEAVYLFARSIGFFTPKAYA